MLTLAIAVDLEDSVTSMRHAFSVSVVLGAIGLPLDHDVLSLGISPTLTVS